MRRLLVSLAALALAACAQQETTAVGDRARHSGASRDLAPGCTAFSYTDLQNQVNAVYGAGTPDANAALGKLSNLQHQLQVGDQAAATAQAFNLADFTVKKYKQGTLLASEADVLTLVNGILCFAGLPPLFGNIGNSTIIYPTDLAQIIRASDGFAGLSLPDFPVSEPTVIAINRLADTPSPLVTNLDVYPLNYDFDKSSATDAPFTQDVTVSVCPASGVPSDVRARLKLGHQDDVDGFEVLPPADGSFIDCTNVTPLPIGMQGIVDAAVARAGDADSSGVVTLALVTGAPGIGGLTDSFSPLAPVDPQLTGSSGVGGTADNFRPLGGTLMSLSGTCAQMEAPIGSPLADACRPSLTIQTFLGTKLHNVPATFTVESGGGSVARASSFSCVGGFGSSVQVTSGSDGVSTACWTLGLTAGTNTVTAQAANGGDAVGQTYFVYADANGVVNPTATLVRFTATANPPSALAFTVQPAAGSNIVAGTNIPVTVNVLDKNGDLVLAYNGAVDLTLNKNAFAAGSVTSINAAAGVATYNAVSITTAASNYVISAGATLNGSPVSQAGNTFNVIAGTAVTITKVAGDNQTVAAGTAVPIAPKVLVQDVYGNPTPGLVVLFEAQNNAAGVTGGTQTTDAAGNATVGSWTVLDGPNSLIAYLQSNPLVFTTFTATGTTTLTLMNSCPLGGSSDPLIYPFYFGGSNSRQVKQVELYLSSNGAANVPKTYTIALDARLNSFGNPVIATAVVPVTLTGKTSDALPTAFRFPTAISSANSDKIAFTFRIISNPDGASIFYNSGPCGLGTCKAPKGCAVTEATGTTPLPLGAVRRNSVALRVLGQ